MLVTMMIAANSSKRPQEPKAQTSASSSPLLPTTTSKSPSSVSVAASNLPALGQLGKSSNSSNETVIALEQPTTTAAEIETLPQISGSATLEASASKLIESPSKTTNQDDTSQMIHNQDRRNAAGAVTTTNSAENQDIKINESRDSNEQQHQQRKQSIGRLRAFFLLTRTHLNPFHHNPRNCNHNDDVKHQVKRKKSLDSSSASSSSATNNNNNNNLVESESQTKQIDDPEQLLAQSSLHKSSSSHHRNTKFVNLFNLAQRCFFFKQSSEFSLNTKSSEQHSSAEPPFECVSAKCRSAPVTPIKWNSLHSDAICSEKPTTNTTAAADQIPNGLGSSLAGGCINATSNRQTGTNKPSVRFVESSSRNGNNQSADKARDKSNSKWRAVYTQTSIASDQQPQESDASLRICSSDDSSVANLFKLQDVVEEGESPMNSTSFRQHGYSLIDYISNYLDTIKERRVTPLNIEPGYLKDLIEPKAPESGESFANIMHDFENHIMCGITHWQHPHFHAYFPAGNAYPSILADMLSDALGCVGFSWAASPAYTELEIIMLDWMGKMIGLPDEFLCLSSGSSAPTGSSGSSSGSGSTKQRESKGGGVIQGSASECVLVNLLAARHWAMEKLRKKYPHTQDGILLTKLIGYCSKEAHSCVEKAAMIGFIRMRALDTDEQHSLRGETLSKAIAMDKANGLEPFLVCATLGTTSCVSFDNLAELGPICKEEDIWLHVDAAYAGSALICPEFQYLMKGIELVSSFNMNPNKWMLINFDCSLMWVRDRFKLTRAFVVDPLYLQHSFSDQAIDYRHWGIPLSRRFRALKLWFVIRNYGISGLQAYIRNHVRLAKLFEQLIRQDSRFTINNQVVLGLVCFRLIGSNALNQRLLSMINASGKLHMVPASLEGRYVIRFCVCDQNAKEEDIRYAYECIAQFATELFESIKAGKERIRAISQQNTIDVSNVSLHTQQSASADRLNRMASANQSITSAGLETQSDSMKQHDEQQQQQRATPAARIASPNREAARQYLMASRRNSHAISGENHELPPGGAKSPLQKQVSMQATMATNCGDPLDQTDHDDLEQEIVLDSLASIDGYDYDLDDEDDEVDVDIVNEDDEDVLGTAADCGPEVVSQKHDRNRLKNSQTTPANIATGERDEAEDEVFHLAKERRNRMSLRYKREFFVRVVSDPRVYRASISGDINASSNSLVNNSQQSQLAAAAAAAAITTSVPQHPATAVSGETQTTTR